VLCRLTFEAEAEAEVDDAEGGGRACICALTAETVLLRGGAPRLLSALSIARAGVSSVRAVCEAVGAEQDEGDEGAARRVAVATEECGGTRGVDEFVGASMERDTGEIVGPSEECGTGGEVVDSSEECGRTVADQEPRVVVVVGQEAPEEASIWTCDVVGSRWSEG